MDGKPGVKGRALEVRGLSAGYNGDLAVREIDLDLEMGERMALVGPNGAGKSTLFKAIVKLLPRRGGEVLMHGRPMEESGHVLAYVPQRGEVDWNFPVTVGHVAMMGRVREMGWFGWPGKRDWEIVRESLDRVGMRHLIGRQIGELSGGQQQRVFIARALVQGADVILMDEPLSGVDMTTQQVFFELLEDLHGRGVSFLVAMHDLVLAAEHFDKIALLNRRLVAVGRPSEVLKPELLQEAYGGRVTRIKSGDAMEMVLPHPNKDCCA